MKVLVLNAGSSTQKSCLYNLDGKTLPEHPPEAIWKGDIDWLATADHGLLTVKANGIRQEIPLALQKNNDQGMAILLNTLLSGETKVLEQLSEIDIVAHRVVHGGTDYTGSVVITPKVKETIRDLIILAPNHNPAHVAGIEAIEAVLGNVTQVAVFDTAFHTTIPPKASTYPIPYEWTEKGIRRYGFHGISHQYCSERAAQLLGKSLDSLKLINCHLGNGCSLAAIKNGKSIDTTMGFTPLEGLMMGTRSGSIDPAIVIYLMREYNFTTDQLNDLLNKESGLKGVSGISGDLRAIFDSIDKGNQRAQLAFDIYIHRLQSLIGSMLTSLGGLDALIFTAGVGENAPLVREKVSAGLSFLGVELDQAKNNAHPVDQDIATATSSVRILVIHTEEDWAIAKEAWNIYDQSQLTSTQS